MPGDQETLAWDDSTLNIDWLNIREPILSNKDEVGKSFEECSIRLHHLRLKSSGRAPTSS